jgi:hypothetical protein
MARHSLHETDAAGGSAGWSAPQARPHKRVASGARRAAYGWRRTVVFVGRGRDLVALWWARAAQRRALASLDDRLLRTSD